MLNIKTVCCPHVKAEALVRSAGRGDDDHVMLGSLHQFLNRTVLSHPVIAPADALNLTLGGRRIIFWSSAWTKVPPVHSCQTKEGLVCHSELLVLVLALRWKDFTVGRSRMEVRLGLQPSRTCSSRRAASSQPARAGSSADGASSQAPPLRAKLWVRR